MNKIDIQVKKIAESGEGKKHGDEWVVDDTNCLMIDDFAMTHKRYEMNISNKQAYDWRPDLGLDLMFFGKTFFDTNDNMVDVLKQCANDDDEVLTDLEFEDCLCRLEQACEQSREEGFTGQMQCNLYG